MTSWCDLANKKIKNFLLASLARPYLRHYFIILGSSLYRLACYHVMHTGGGGSSIVKVPGDVPPARVCFFKPSGLAKGILIANFSPFSLAKGILFGNFGQRNVKLR